MGKCTVNKVWFEKTDSLGYKISEWAKEVDKTQIFCIVCSNNIQCEKKGHQALLQHSINDKHKNNCKKFNESTTIMSSGNLELGVYCKQEDASKAELMWTMKSVLCNMSGSSCDGLVELFKAMFPNAVPDKFSLSRSKMSNLITDALGPHFRQIVLDGIQNHSTYYTLMYDETTNSESKKELQVAVRYWCNTKKEIVGGPSDGEDYSVIQTEKGIPSHRFIKHCSSHWLTLGAAAERILEQWEALMHYFKIFVPKHRNEILRTPKFLKISSFIKLVELKPEIIFVVNSAKMFQQFTLTFQRQEPLIHVMYD
ncbi:hypothetical protein ACI65C_011409 [Semiaphis heraclei]